ncbi:hypothetical protein [Micromonospora maritima]|uniref:hypothetical protein n=1 Tax=Micromonospora maritima TaxID=986711 RepID=UPI00157CB4FA|nr:hypothetical protein [Micromonospora maritima]
MSDLHSLGWDDDAPATPQTASGPVGPYTATGELPAFTASGIDPKVLLRSPAPVRPAIAAAPTTAEAYAIAQRYAGMSDADAARALATDMSVPADLAHTWASTNNVDLNTAGRDYQPDVFIARGQQVRAAAERQHRDRMQAIAKASGDDYSYRRGAA